MLARSVIAALALTVAGHASAQLVTSNVDFKVPSAISQQNIPDGFNQLNWSDIGALDAWNTKTQLAAGYKTAADAGPSKNGWVAYTQWGKAGSFSSDTPFSLASTSLTGSWAKQARITVTGWYEGGHYTKNIFITSDKVTTTNFENWTNLTKVTFQYAPQNAQQNQGQGQIIFSNLALTRDVTAPVPEPETWALTGLGLAGLLLARRRKQKAA